MRNGLIGALVALVLYAACWPLDVEPGKILVATAPTLPLSHVRTHTLGKGEPVHVGEGRGPEHVVFDEEGKGYTGLAGGEVTAFGPGPAPAALLARTGGRPLGMALDRQGRLVVADPLRGLLRITSEGKVVELAKSTNEGAVHFANSVVVPSSGDIYFTDSSVGAFEDGVAREALETRPSGRLLRFAADKEAGEPAEVMATGFYFANGLVVSPDESHLVIAETLAYRLRRYWLVGPKRGRVDTLVENLPGFPDNISTDGECYWLALAAPRNPGMDFLQGQPFLSSVVLRFFSLLPEPPPPAEGMFLAIDLRGKLKGLWTGRIGFGITTVVHRGGFFYLGSLLDRALRRVRVPDAWEGS